MKKQHGSSIVGLLAIVIVLLGIGSWVWNAVKLTACDFELNFKCEVIHTAGLVVPPLSIITVWFDDDEA